MEALGDYASTGAPARTVGAETSDTPDDDEMTDQPPTASDPRLEPSGEAAVPVDDGTEPPSHLLELRQVAGLTAGSAMQLNVGLFQFRESDRAVGFSLDVRGPDEVYVVPGAVTATIDEFEIDQPTLLGASILHVGSACFTVRRPRAVITGPARLAEIEAVRTPPPPIPVPDLSIDAPEVAPTRPRSGLFSRAASESAEPPTRNALDFLDAIGEARSDVAERQRRLHPDPEEIRARLTRLDPGLWERGVEHPMFTRFPIAYSTIPWEPRFDAPERIPSGLYEPIDGLSRLPWVPVTSNLLFGPLGIVGSRQAALACARNAVLSLASMTALGDLEFSIITSQEFVADWEWTANLPATLFPTGKNRYCVAVADAMTHFENSGLDQEMVKRNEMGLIVLGETIDDLPEYCGSVLQIDPDGSCTVTNHLGEQVVGTPIGVPTTLASEIALDVAAALDMPGADE